MLDCQWEWPCQVSLHVSGKFTPHASRNWNYPFLAYVGLWISSHTVMILKLASPFQRTRHDTSISWTNGVAKRIEPLCKVIPAHFNSVLELASLEPNELLYTDLMIYTHTKLVDLFWKLEHTLVDKLVIFVCMVHDSGRLGRATQRRIKEKKTKMKKTHGHLKCMHDKSCSR